MNKHLLTDEDDVASMKPEFCSSSSSSPSSSSNAPTKSSNNNNINNKPSNNNRRSLSDVPNFHNVDNCCAFTASFPLNKDLTHASDVNCNHSIPETGMSSKSESLDDRSVNSASAEKDDDDDSQTVLIARGGRCGNSSENSGKLPTASTTTTTKGVASLTNCCAGGSNGGGNEKSDESETKLNPRKITRRKTKSSVGVDGELKKELFLPDVDFGAIDCRESARQLATRVWEAGWRVVPHHALPAWLQDNDYLLRGHRPQLQSFLACFQSIFRIHTETGNIWTHLLGAWFFIGITVYFFLHRSLEFPLMDKLVFFTFFAAAIICLSCSWLFHTVSCHSPCVSFVFSKLDYCGIAILTMGSFVPWLYYGFYCQFFAKMFYLVAIMLLGTAAIVVSLWDKFSAPAYRNLRAGLFIGLGLSGVIPAIHYSAREGLTAAFTTGALGWLLLMAALYIGGALMYAMRIPEKWFPGYCDIWFQSHQIFHICVVAAAFVHYHGICLLSAHTLSNGDCQLPEAFQ